MNVPWLLPRSRKPVHLIDTPKKEANTGSYESAPQAGSDLGAEPSAEPQAGLREEPQAGRGEEPQAGPRAAGTVRIAVWLATAGGVGFGPWAPGTWGALEAVLLFALVFCHLGLPLYGLVVVAICAVGIWASGLAEGHFGQPDDGRIVIDEVAGQLVALAPLVLLWDLPLGRIALPGGLLGTEWTAGAGIDIRWLLVVTAFVAFRWFDIRKPGPVRWAEERFTGGVGVMADDIVAGVLAAVVVTLPAYTAVVALLREKMLESGVLEAVVRISSMLPGWLS